MGAAAFIGRIGGLAVALGVGTAIAAGHGVAWADDSSDSSLGGAPSSASQGSSPAGSIDATKAGADTSSSAAAGTRPGLSVADSRLSALVPSDSAAKATIGNGRATARDAVERAQSVADASAQRTAPDSGASADAVKPDDVGAKVSDARAAIADTASADTVQQQQRAATAADQPRSTRNSTPVTQASDVSRVASRPEAKGGYQRVVSTAVAQEARTAVATEETAAKQVVDVRFAADAATKAVSAVAADRAAAADAVPVMTTAVQEKAAAATTTSVLAVVPSLLAAVVSPLAGTGPGGAPSVSPLSWVMLAAARREVGIAGTTGQTDATTSPTAITTTSATTGAPQAAVATPSTVSIAWVTGPSGPNQTPARFTVGGTDLGIMWDNGATGANRQVLIAFGDTFGDQAMTTDWRSNILFRSADRVLSDANGLWVPDPQYGNIYAGSPVLLNRQTYAKQLVYGIPGTIGLFGIPALFGSEVTIIPTTGIAVPGMAADGGARQYMSVMSVRQWGSAGMWTTNYSAIAYSDDNGENWTIDPNTIRSAGFLRTWGHTYVPGDENFQQGAFVRPPAGSPDAQAGYVYYFGTPAGRFGSAYLSRVNERQIQDLSAYEYWNGNGWVRGNPGAAVPVFPDQPSPFSGLISLANNLLALFGIPLIIPNGDVSEMSVQYNEYLDKYIVLYTNSSGVVMRTADRPEGPWSDTTTLVTAAQYPGLYAPMIHPWSSTGYLLDSSGTPEDPKYLYWNLSQWGQYNVRLMRTELSTVQV